MRLVVEAYKRDDSASMDCHFCDDDDQDNHINVLTFYEEVTQQTLVVCPDHLDEMVRAALDRHRKGMEAENPYWYLDADENPWEDLA